MKFSAIILLALLCFPRLQAQSIEEAAKTFLSTLDEPLKQRTVYTFEDAERFNWGFVPRTRNGPTFHDFNEKQKQAALNLLKVSLSEQGYRKAIGITQLENVLREIESRGPTDNYRDPLNYHITIFGTPSKDQPWGWRFEGHHCSLNFVSTSGMIVSSTPSFFGSNPGIVPSGQDRGKEVLKLETDLGFQLVNSLTPKQLAIARFSETALPEIVTSNDRTAKQLSPEGIRYADMNDKQKEQLRQLLEVYVSNYAFEFASKFMAKIKQAGFENLSFAWAGSLKPGAGHYYRIQGPMLLIEYDNTQNNANHVHTAVRDLTTDFGDDILREHYKTAH